MTRIQENVIWKQRKKQPEKRKLYLVGKGSVAFKFKFICIWMWEKLALQWSQVVTSDAHTQIERESWSDISYFCMPRAVVASHHKQDETRTWPFHVHLFTPLHHVWVAHSFPHVFSPLNIFICVEASQSKHASFFPSRNKIINVCRLISTTATTPSTKWMQVYAAQAAKQRLMQIVIFEFKMMEFYVEKKRRKSNTKNLSKTEAAQRSALTLPRKTIK